MITVPDCSDLIGWIYIADSDIDYPVVKGQDNQFYLNHGPDGAENPWGTIFLDRQCKSDFSGRQNILYGHNFEYGMFADLRFFREKSKFDAHRFSWLITSDQIYRIDFFALVIVSAYDRLYIMPTENAVWQEAIEKYSRFCNGEALSEEDRCIALSTCTWEFEDARLLLIGRMMELTEQEALGNDNQNVLLHDPTF